MAIFKKIFIANRGEIACRAIRPARELKIPVVVGYSDCDALSLHVKLADEAVRLGPSPANMSYLNIDAILRAARDSGCDAVFPGYGFLAENADFADAVTKANMTFIGPSAEAMRILGDKIQARKLLYASGVPVTPAIENVDDPEEVVRFGNSVGWPILLKAAGGGGGKGMQKVSSPAQVEECIAAARSVAEKAFKNGTIFAEKYIENGRHIEFQFLGDKYGNVIHLGERECSIQRRYQKIIEETPSPVVTAEDRARLYAYTAKFVQDIGYCGAGTIEYLRGADGTYYFMEINARLQVEHPVTEMVSGLDLVEWQIRVANGEKLAFDQAGITLSGHAIECRIYAEDPKTFRPSPGTITRLVFPDTKKAEMRLEHSIWEGYKVSPFYDPLLCKLIVWEKDRDSCIGGVTRALSEFRIEGIASNIPTNLAIMRNKKFVSGNFATNFLNFERVNIGLENYLVTISRQFGCPGKTIAKKMAELLGVEYYDRDILEQVADEMNLPVPRLEDGEVEAEYVKLLFPLGTGTQEEKERIFEAQQKIILQFAEKNSGIFLGRCADYILRNHANLFSIYIYAPREARRDFCVKHLHIPQSDVDRIMDEADEARLSYSMNYAKVYSQTLENKNILIDSSLFGHVDETAEVLVSMIRRKFNLA